MKLYEINLEIDEILNSFEIDTETGELLGTTDELLEKLSELQIERTEVLKYLAKEVLNLRAEQEMLKAEEARLKARRDRLSKKTDHIMSVLDRECAGKKTDLEVATVSYRKTTSVNVEDPDSAIAWLKEGSFDTCYRTPAPEIAKSEVKKLLKEGVTVPGCSIVESYNCSLK